MPLNYRTGEEIRKNGRVTYYGEPGEIELVADPEMEDIPAEALWHAKEFGGGVLIREPKVFGRVFIRSASLSSDEHLEFVSRDATVRDESSRNE